MTRSVLVLASLGDLHADAVIDQCWNLGLVPLRLFPEGIVADQAEFTLTVEPDSGRWRIKKGDRQIEATDDYVVFCREWELSSVASSDDLARSVASEEARAALHGWICSVSPDRCIDHPLIQQR